MQLEFSVGLNCRNVVRIFFSGTYNCDPFIFYITMRIKSMLYYIYVIYRLRGPDEKNCARDLGNGPTPRDVFKTESRVFLIRIELHVTAGSCVSERTGCKKPARSERLLSQSHCFILIDKK
jgi:hypothetical protein